jgi:broad specificity phosphatase PhoE
MEVILIRHGDPDYANDALTERGHVEARALGEHLRNEPIDALYCSPMGRARLTMGYTARVKGMEGVILDWLHELNGDFDNGRWCWNVPGAEALNRRDVPDAEAWHTEVPYGDLMRPQYDDVGRKFDDLLGQYGYEREGLRYRVTGRNNQPALVGLSDRPQTRNGATLAMFCHGGLILTLLAYLLHWPPPLVYSHLCYDPTGVTRLVWLEVDGYAVPKARTINDLSHLTRPNA